jgi:hypothetical protein
MALSTSWRKPKIIGNVVSARSCPSVLMTTFHPPLTSPTT